MRRAFVVRITVLLLFALVAGTAPIRAAPAIRSVGNDHFEVVGLHLRSVTYMSELSLFAVEMAERYLDREGMAYPLPILVTLRPDAYVNFEGDYSIRIEQRGAVQLDIRWEESTTLELSCRALSEALLAQYSLYNFGPEAMATLRSWPVSALAQDVYLGLRPAKFVDLLNRTRASEAPELTTVVESTLQASGEVDPAYGYWLLELMKTGGIDRRITRGLFQQALAGINIKEALTLAVQPGEPTAEPLSVETWWREELAALLAREYEAVETMATSQVWLAAMAQFAMPLKLDSGELTLNLRSLWTHRNQPEVKEWVRARYEILRLRMARINPAYYNPARSLGVIFESLLSDAPPHNYLHALTIYLSDWEDAKDMQETIERKLGSSLFLVDQ